jgi:hypothetical protein
MISTLYAQARLLVLPGKYIEAEQSTRAEDRVQAFTAE